IAIPMRGIFDRIHHLVLWRYRRDLDRHNRDPPRRRGNAPARVERPLPMVASAAKHVRRGQTITYRNPDMSVEVKIPAVGESITSGIVSVWHKKSGDFVNAGDALFTLETDKVSTEIAAEISGVLDPIVPEGQEVKIGEVVATIDDSKKAPAAKPTEEKAPAKS